MKILLISRNRVVQEIIKIAAKKISADFKTQDSIESLKKDSYYDWVFCDETTGLCDKRSLPENIVSAKTVCLHSKEYIPDGRFDFYIEKPFIPLDIVELIESNKKASEKASDTKVLDYDEIEKIKSLLESGDTESALDIFDSGEEEFTLFNDDKEELISLDAEDLIDKIYSMKPKKLKRLLAGAEVTISIKFPKAKK